MKAVIVKEVGVLELQDVLEPEPNSDQIKVKIAYSGICGSDLKIIDSSGMPEPLCGAIGWAQKNAPIREGARILGHEASGTIVKIGKDIKGNFKVGQRVPMNFFSTCGSCYYCLNGMAQYCERLAYQSGAMTEYATYQENIVFPIPDDVPLDIAAFCEPVSIAVHAIDIAHIKAGDSVIITGGGSIGLLILQLAIKSGAAKVLVSEPIAERRKMAKQLGADVVVDPLTEDLLKISNKFTDGRGYNVCFEASGKVASAIQLVLLAEVGGAIVLAATYPENVDITIPIFYLWTRDLTIRTVMPNPHSFPRAVQILRKLNLKPLIKVYPLTEAITAFGAFKMGKGIKIMLQP